MATFLDDLDTAIDGLGNAIDFLGGGAKTVTDFSQNGFIVPPIPGADGNGLPSSKLPNQRIANFRRSMIHWFVPEFGVVKMYVNPSEITYSHSKQITQERTKGGFNLQYWGENLGKLNMRGTTGSSGIEGINVLYEIYRAEQLAFDAVGLTLAADAVAQDLASSLVTTAGNAIGGAFGDQDGIGGAIASSLLGTDASAQALAPRNIPSLAQFAFGIEMFYQGWVHRGFFNSMTITENVTSLGLFDYSIEFFVTERRGYRTNYLPWHKSAIDGPSGDAIPYSFAKLR